MSETDTAREELRHFCQGMGLDVGFGGSAIVPHAITFDLPSPYTKVGQDTQIIRGDCRNLSMFCDESLAWISSAHIAEDFTYAELPAILLEWRRVLKKGGLLITNCPDQQKFLAHCAATGQGINWAHKEPDFSLATFKKYALEPTGPWQQIFEKPEHGPYSFLLVMKKV